MPKIVERIGVLEERLKQLKAKQQKIDARKRALESRQARQADTRRKFLAGAIVLAQVERDADANAQFRRWVDQSLRREDDRALFDLPPVSREAASERPTSPSDQKAAEVSGG
jgi:septal ring factor EnvC (AmiA/AmiB activator)